MLLKYRKRLFFIWLLSVLSYYILDSYSFTNIEIDTQKISRVTDEFNSVNVYYNGSIYNV